MGRGGTLPGRLQTPVLIGALVALHLFLPGPVESARLDILRHAARPLQVVGRQGASSLAPFSAEEVAWLAQARAGFRHAAQAPGPGAGLLPVLDLDTRRRRRRLLLGGGRNLGLRRDALVFRKAGCLGVVDRVEEHLARVRLLSAKRTSLPVRVENPGRELPGGIDVLHGVLMGDGEGAFLTDTFLPQAFRKGDAIVTLEDEGRAPRPVGVVETTGVRPRIRLATLPDGVSLLEVEGAARSSEAGELFQDQRFRLLFRASGCYRGAVIEGPGTGDLLPGSAVHRGGWFLGIVTSTGLRAAGIHPATHPGQELTVLVVDRERQSFPARIRGAGSSGARVERWMGKTPCSGPVLVVTAGGQQLVPPWLVVGRGEWDGERLSLSVPDRWPAEVLVAVFRYAGERRRLMGGRR